jgi:hypothetical protein
VFQMDERYDGQIRDDFAECMQFIFAYDVYRVHNILST